MKTILILSLAAALSACGPSPSQIKSEPLEMTVIKVTEKSSCLGTDFETVLRSQDNRVAMLCGYWGSVGDKVSGCWETGHTDAISDTSRANGFYRICKAEK